MNKIYSLLILIAFCVSTLSCHKPNKNNQKSILFDNCTISLTDTTCNKLDKIASDYILLGGSLDTTNYWQKANSNSYPQLITNTDLHKMTNAQFNEQYLSLTRILKKEDVYTNVQDENGRVTKILLPKGSKVTFLWQPELGKQGIYYLFALLGWIEPVHNNANINIVKFNKQVI